MNLYSRIKSTLRTEFWIQVYILHTNLMFI